MAEIRIEHDRAPHECGSCELRRHRNAEKAALGKAPYCGELKGWPVCHRFPQHATIVIAVIRRDDLTRPDNKEAAGGYQ